MEAPNWTDLLVKRLILMLQPFRVVAWPRTDSRPASVQPSRVRQFIVGAVSG